MTDMFSTPDEHAMTAYEPEASSSDIRSYVGPSTASFGDATEGLNLEEAFEVEESVRRIIEGNYKTVGLQFPDELLSSSVSVYRAIQTRIAHTGAQAYVLADSTYGNCCPDILSCLHLPADFLVHYGHACLTPTGSLPVHYVFHRKRLDVERAKQSLIETSSEDLEKKKGVIVVWDVAYDWLANDIQEIFSKACPLPINFASIHTVPTTLSSPSEKGKTPTLRAIDPPKSIPMNECVLWYIGEEGRSCMNIQMTHANNPLYIYSPVSQTTSPLHSSTSRLLSRRLFALHQALSADIFGLIVSNIGLSSSQLLLKRLREDLKRAKKKSYTLTVGRLNPAKLANFAEIECFVLIGCAEGGVVDSKDFLRPIITPWELELALQGSDHIWAPEKWTLDFDSVLRDAQQRATEWQESKSSRTSSKAEDSYQEKGDDDDDTPQFSLISGQMRTRRTFPSHQSSQGALEGRIGDLTLRNQILSLAKLESAGSSFLASRDFRGLEARVGMDEPSCLEEGRRGVARGYTEEK
ncbi:diphthamide biosynthesis protein 2 [Cryptococcus depauperatus CBS 7841]|uniref:2-(3-amino-3-carboxypropyl)histidine synthase subunit 2 n=1 Tax=Cryptococcus depauperatus CBS 7841 TaxID=1295531 RepID=A0A1E3IG28_9TREE|nr:diphthamide biosynthesis protein 2 [Cryptococcus depauperatus CBS 7841]